MVKELMKQGDRSLVLWETGKATQYVVCSYFDPTKEEGSMWIWGHYFMDLPSALDYLTEGYDTYYEVLLVRGNAESVIDTAWDFESAKASAEAAKEINPIKSDTFRVVSYRYHKIELEL